jgi:amino acid adenylation domain-containing protein
MMKVKLLQEYMISACDRDPEATSARDGSSSVTYGQVQESANRLARCLKSIGVQRGDRVIVSLQRSTKWMGAIQGILCADAAYVPIDTEMPSTRWRSVLEDSSPSAILVDHAGYKRALQAMSDTRHRVPLVLVADEADLEIEKNLDIVLPDQLLSFSSEKVEFQNSGDDLAYIMYTSGSTGTPKGVMISHGNVTNYVDWAVSHFGLKRDDRILGTAPFSFDMSTFDIHATMGAGATLLVVPSGLTLFPAKLVDFMEKEGATVWKGISSLLMYISRVGALGKADLKNLRAVMFAGESLPVAYLADWMKALTHTEFHNCFGPTEATGVSISYRVPMIPSEGEKVPIGLPCKKGMEAFLIDENGSLVPPGEVGEILLAGPGLSSGYWNDPDRTEAAFINYPVESGELVRAYCTGDLARYGEDGNLEFMGRKDRQVKIMGYRIELGDIEHHLMMLDGVEEAFVTAVTSDGGEHNELVVFYVGPEDTPNRLRDGLCKSLPLYMVPKKFVKLQDVPRCPRGKVSYEALLSCLEKE